MADAHQAEIVDPGQVRIDVASADRQRDVSALSHGEDVSNPTSAPDGSSSLLLRLIGADPGAADAVLEAAGTSQDPSLLVAAALLSGDRAYLARASEQARTSRERQLV